MEDGMKKRKVTLLVLLLLPLWSWANDPIKLDLPNCGSLNESVDDSSWYLDRDDTVISFWAKDRLYVSPGRGMVYRVAAQSLKRSGVQLGAATLGKNASTVVTSSGGSAILVDAGGPKAVYINQLEALAREMGVKEIRGLIISHADTDHYNRIIDAIKKFKIPAHKLMIPDFQLPFAKTLRSRLTKARQDPELKKLGYDSNSIARNPYASSVVGANAKTYTARFEYGDLVVRYVATKDSVDKLRQVAAEHEKNEAQRRKNNPNERSRRLRPPSGAKDSASPLKTIAEYGRPHEMVIVGDLRGRDYLALEKEMGERNFAKLFRDVPIIKGFQHHLGNVGSVADVSGILKVLRYAGQRDPRNPQPLRVVVQTTDHGRFKVNMKLIGMLQEFGVEVIKVGKPTGDGPGNVRVDRRAVHVSGGGTEIFAAKASALKARQQMNQIDLLLRTLNANQADLNAGNAVLTNRLRAAVKQAHVQAQNLFWNGRRQATFDQLLGSKRRGATNAANRAANIDAAALAGNNQAIANAHAPVQALLDANPVYKQQIDMLGRNLQLNRRLSIEIQSALANGKASRTLWHLFESIDPGIRKRWVRKGLPRHKTLVNALRQQQNRNLLLAGAQRTTSGQRLRAGRAQGWIEVANLFMNAYSLLEDGQNSALNRAYAGYTWWRARSVLPKAVGVIDNHSLQRNQDIDAQLTGVTYGITDLTEMRLRGNTDFDEEFFEKFNYHKRTYGSAEVIKDELRPRMGASIDRYWPLMQRHMMVSRTHPFDAFSYTIDDYRGFVTWSAVVQNYDDFRQHFVEMDEPIVQPANRSWTKWKYKIFESSWQGPQQRWVSDPQFDQIMNDIYARVVDQTRTALENVWANREPKVGRGAGPSIGPAPEFGIEPLSDVTRAPHRPTSKVRFLSDSSRELYSRFNLEQRIVGSGDWQEAPVLYAFENATAPRGYVLVTGAKFGDYATVRSAELRRFDQDGVEPIPRRSIRSERHRYLLEGRRLSQENGEFVPTGDDYEGEIRYWYSGFNMEGLAYAKKADLQYVSRAMQSPANVALTAGPPAPICSTFDEHNDRWQEFDGYRLKPATAVFHETSNRNSFLVSQDVLEKPALDLVVVFDVTGSMGKHIVSVRENLARVVDAIATHASKIRLGAVSYRDHADNSADARQLFPLSADIAAQKLQMDAWQATGGGSDKAEDLLYGLEGVFDEQMGWQDDDRVGRLVLIITDAPAKLSSDGADFAGRTLATIGTTARDRKISLHTLVIDGDDLTAQAQTLADLSGGSVRRVSESDTLVNQLIASVQRAVGPRLRYWQAPRHYLGDKAAYAGRSVQFDLRCDGEYVQGRAPDLEIIGGGSEARIYSQLRPINRLAYENWHRYIAALSPQGGWVTKFGRPLKEDEITKILSDVSGIRIKADYQNSPGRCFLDNVAFGTTATPNVRSLTEEGRGDAQALDQILERAIKELGPLTDRDALARLIAQDMMTVSGSPIYSVIVEETVRKLWEVFHTPSVRSIWSEHHRPFLERVIEARAEVLRTGRYSDSTFAEEVRRYRAIEQQIQQNFQRLRENYLLQAVAYFDRDNPNTPRHVLLGIPRHLRDLEDEARRLQFSIRNVLTPGNGWKVSR